MFTLPSMYVAWRQTGVKCSGELSDVLRNVAQRKNVSPVACLKAVGPQPIPPEATDSVVHETSTAYIALQQRQNINLSTCKYYTAVDISSLSLLSDLHVLFKTRPVEDSQQPQDSIALTDLCTPLAYLSDSTQQSVCKCTVDQYVSIVDHFLKRSLLSVPEIVEVESVAIVDVTGTPQAAESGATQHESSIPTREEREKTEVNILIYVGTLQRVQHYYYFIRDALKEGKIDQDSYTVYMLSKADLLLGNWLKCCELLIVADPYIWEDGVACNIFEEFFKYGGHILTSGTRFEERFCNLKEYPKASGLTDEQLYQNADIQEVGGKHLAHVALSRNYFADTKSLKEGATLTALAETKDSQLVILEATNANNGKAIFSQVQLHQKFESRGVLMTWMFSHLGVRRDPNIDKKNATLCQIYSPHDEMREKFMSHIGRRSLGSTEGDTLTIAGVTDFNLNKPEEDGALFDWKGYAENLKSKMLGNILLFQAMCASTQLLIPPFNSIYDPKFGVVAIARQQYSGVGRGSNLWISPEGSLSLSLQIAFPMSSNLGRAPAILQTIPAVAVARIFSDYIPASPKSPQCKVSVKWPNDIYYKQKKIGGVIASCSTAGDQLLAIVGVGVNVMNLKPSVNVNDVVLDYNTINGALLPFMSVGCLAAKMCTDMEYLIELINKDKSEYLNQYYKHWMHSGVKVRVPEHDDKESLIVGLDEHGYLRLQSEDGSTFSVQPDGNSFDILHNLITIKERRS